MTPRLHRRIAEWELQHPISTWNFVPTGLSIYADFIGCYGFRMWDGYGWERVHTLAFATELQNNRKHSGNWRSFWKRRSYAM